MRSLVLNLLIAACFACGLSTVFPLSASAQEPPKNETKKNETSPAKNDQPAAKPSPDGLEAKHWERTIYLPYRELKDVFEKYGEAVFLPYAEYLRLSKKAEGRMPDAPPVAAVINAVEYKASVDGELVRVEAEFTVRVLHGPWAELPLRFGDAAIGSVTSEETDVLFRGTGTGSYSLLFPKTGEYKVRLQLSTRVLSSANGKQFVLECPPVGVTTLDFVVPEREQTVALNPRGVLLPTSAGKQETRVKARLGATGKIAATWHPREGVTPELELLANATNHSQVLVEDRLIHTHSVLAFDILRGSLKQVRIAVPKGERVLDVVSPNAKMKAWKQESDAAVAGQVIVVEFFDKMQEKVSVEVDTERTVVDGPLNIAGMSDSGEVFGVHALGVLRESGQLVVTQGQDLELTIEQQQGVVRIQEHEVAESIRRSGSLAFKYYNPRFVLALTATPIQPRLVVNHRSRLTFKEEELRLKADLAYTIEKAGVFDLQLSVPEGLVIDDVLGEGIKTHTVNEEADRLTVSFSEKRQGSLGLTIEGHRRMTNEAAESDQLLPLLEPLNVVRETGWVTVYAPDAIEVITNPDKVIAAQPTPPEQVEPRAQLRVAAAWNYSRRPVEIPVKTRRRPTRLTAYVGTAIDMRQGLVHITTQLDYDVQYAGVDTFRFSVPEAVADQVQIRSTMPPGSAGIRQKSRAEEPRDGWVTWTVLMQRPVVGAQRFEVSYDLVPPGDAETEKSEATEIVIQTLRAMGLGEDGDESTRRVALTHITGEIVIDKERTLSVSASPLDEDLQPIDVRELTGLSREGTLAYRYFKQPVGVKLATVKHETQQVVETVVSRALVEIVIGRDQAAVYRCRYRLKSSERQRLAVDLPAGMELLGLLVDDKPADAQKQSEEGAKEKWNSFFVNVARSKRSDEPFSLTFQFRIPLSDPFEGGRGDLVLPLPRFGGAETSGVVVQEVRTAVWVPDRIALVGASGSFQSERNTLLSGLPGFPCRKRPIDLDKWIGVPALSMIDFPTEGRAYRYRSLNAADRFSVEWWNLRRHIWVWTGALFFAAFVLRTTSWENKLGLVILACVVFVMVALRDVDTVVVWLQVAQYGLIALVAIWGIHLLLGAKRDFGRAKPAKQAPTDSATTDQPETTPPPADADPPPSLPVDVDTDEPQEP